MTASFCEMQREFAAPRDDGFVIARCGEFLLCFVKWGFCGPLGGRGLLVSCGMVGGPCWPGARATGVLIFVFLLWRMCESLCPHIDVGNILHHV